MVDFRTRLVATLRAAAPVFEVPGVVVVGSEVPNLLEPGARSTLVVSQDVWVDRETLEGLATRRRLDRHLDGELLAAPALALVPFGRSAACLPS